MYKSDKGKRWVLVHTETGELVRRYEVPGGWLYQVQCSYSALGDPNDPNVWGAPVFVPKGLET